MLRCIACDIDVESPTVEITERGLVQSCSKCGSVLGRVHDERNLSPPEKEATSAPVAASSPMRLANRTLPMLPFGSSAWVDATTERLAALDAALAELEVERARLRAEAKALTRQLSKAKGAPS